MSNNTGNYSYYNDQWNTNDEYKYRNIKRARLMKELDKMDEMSENPNNDDLLKNKNVYIDRRQINIKEAEDNAHSIEIRKMEIEALDKQYKHDNESRVIQMLGLGLFSIGMGFLIWKLIDSNKTIDNEKELSMKELKKLQEIERKFLDEHFEKIEKQFQENIEKHLDFHIKQLMEEKKNGKSEN